MARVTLVTGYIPIPGYPHRQEDEFHKFGDELRANFEWYQLWVQFNKSHKDTWLHEWLFRNGHGRQINHSTADNPDKNTLAYHCVQHEKFRWLQRAAREDALETDIFVWIDYGILHVPGVTVKVIRDYLARLNEITNIWVPGCWHRDNNISQEFPCWRFCGGLMAIPAHHVEYFSQLCRVIAMEHITKTNNVEWEVNTLARVELTDKLPIKWYQADHNETMFANLP